MAVHEELERSRTDALYFEQYREELLQRYPERWLAVPLVALVPSMLWWTLGRLRPYWRPGMPSPWGETCAADPTMSPAPGSAVGGPGSGCHKSMHAATIEAQEHRCGAPQTRGHDDA